MAIAGWLIREKGVWVPAFAGMTGVAGGDGLVAPGLRGWWVSETRVWVPAFAGMTEGAGVECGWGAGYGCVWKWGVFVAIADLRVVETGVWVPAPDRVEGRPFAGMTDGEGRVGRVWVWVWAVFVAMIVGGLWRRGSGSPPPIGSRAGLSRG